MPIPNVSQETLNIWGIVLASIIFLESLGSVIVWRKRRHPLIRVRSPPLYFINLGLGVFGVGMSTCFWFAVYPRLQCAFLAWLTFLIHTFYTLPYVLRAAKFLYLYSATQSRIQQREALQNQNISYTSQSSQKSRSSRRVKTWLSNDKYLLGLWGILGIIHLLLATIINLLFPVHENTCQASVENIAVSTLLTLIYVIVISSLVYFLKTAKDAYYLKQEAKLISIIWIIFAILWTVWQVTGWNFIPAFVFPMAGIIFSFFCHLWLDLLPCHP
eukprot:TRINITY_DN17577_c0_g1_i1.p1 TRINITY_DN17577_c0_g1~~TRINITY_DN17577_c0_g1_i1.p1  ORF type:complete len:298 (-),score=24.56 TRINITY_DN17577_c0_g1_i1:258-1073(-)